MRVALVCAESVTDGYAPHAHIRGLTKAMVRLGYGVSVVGVDSGRYHGSSFGTRLKRYFTVNWRAIGMIKHHDVMIARGHFAHYPWTLVAYLRGTPVIHEMNGLMFDAATSHPWLTFAQRLISSSYRRQFAMAHGITCVTKEIADRVRQLGVKAPLRIIGNGVDIETFYPSEDNTSENFAIFPSALAAWHGVSTLLAAVDHSAWPPGLELVIVGDGTQAPAVKERAERDTRVRYVGLLPHVELAAMMRKAAIGLSLVESIEERGITEVYPLKLFEMMASGLPIVATSVPGQQDVLLDSRAGVVVPPHDPEALAKAVAYLLVRKDRLAMGQAGSSAVKKSHSWDHRASELDTFIRQTIFREPGASAQEGV